MSVLLQGQSIVLPVLCGPGGEVDSLLHSLSGQTPQEQVDVGVFWVDTLVQRLCQQLVGPDVNVPTARAGAALELGKRLVGGGGVASEQGLVGEGLGNLLGHPVVGEDHTFGHGLVDPKVLFGFDAFHHTLGFKLELNFGARFKLKGSV